MIWAMRFGILLAVSALSAPPALGGYIHVGTGQTYTTIQSGFAAAVSGDTILIDDGNYVLPSTLNVTKSVTFQAVNIGGARVSGGGSGPDDSIFFLSADATFFGLYFSDSNSAHAIYQRDTGAHGIVRNSIFVGIQNPLGINNSGGTAGSYDVAHATIVNALDAVNINDGGTITIRNSIIAHTNTAYVAHANIAILPDHNLLFNVNAVTGGGGSIATDPAQIIADPLFFNPAGLDFRLQAGSSAIDSGRNLGQPFHGAAPDRGAFEFGAVTAVPEPSSLVLVAFGALSLVGYGWRRRDLGRLARDD